MGADNTQLDRIERERKKVEGKIIIFGAGIRGKRLLNCVRKEKVAYFVDNDSSKIGKQIEGIEVISYLDMLNINENYTVVVTPIKRAEIIQRLVQDGIEYMEVEWYLLLNEQNCNPDIIEEETGLKK